MYLVRLYAPTDDSVPVDGFPEFILKPSAVFALALGGCLRTSAGKLKALEGRLSLDKLGLKHSSLGYQGSPLNFSQCLLFRSTRRSAEALP